MDGKTLLKWIRNACAAILTITCFSCGGGGGGDDDGGSSFPGFTPASVSTRMTIDESNAANAAAMVALAHNIGTVVGPSGVYLPLAERNLPQDAKASKVVLRTVLDRLKEHLSGNGYHSAGAGSAQEECPYGGSYSISSEWVGPDVVYSECDMIDLQGAMTMSDCRWDGESIMDGSISFQYTGSPCDATSMSIVLDNFAFSVADTQILSRHLEIIASDLLWWGDSITSGTTVLNGQVVSVDGNEEIAAAFYDFTEVATTYIGDDDYTYLSIDVSGGITGPCLDGWAYVQTDSQIPIILGQYTCPLDGRIVISGDISIDAIYYYDGSMEVGGVLYDSCEDLNMTCALP